MSATDAVIIAASIDDPVRFAQIFDRHADAIRHATGQPAAVVRPIA